MKLGTRLRRFVADLRRRRVFRVTAAYLAVAFVLLQVAEIVFPALSLDRGLTIAVVVAIAGLPLVVVLAWIYDVSPLGVVRTPPMEAEEEGVPETSEPELDRHSIAVLPFEQVGDGDDDGYFADGVHEDVLTTLSKVGDLRVVSRNSVMRFRGTGPDPLDLGRELGVGSVLEGTVRRVGTQVRISVRLVDTRTRSNVWADAWDRSVEDIFAIQRDLALRIVEALRAELSDEEEARIEATPTDDFEAYDAYLRGRHLWNQRTERGLLAAIGPLEEAIGRDPDFALAHSGLADALLTQALYGVEAPEIVMPRAREASERALALDPGLGEAWAARGCVRALWTWDWEGARADLQRAVESSPSYATARQWLAIHVLAPLSRFDEADRVLGEAASLDPDSPAIEATAVFLLYLRRRYEDAERRCRRLVAATPAFALAHQFLGQILLRRGEPEAGLAAVRRASELRGDTPEVRAGVAVALVGVGREEEARRIAEELERMSVDAYVPATRLARIDAALGRVDRALEHLEVAVEQRATDLVWARTDPEFDPLRQHPRFMALIDRMGVSDAA